FALQRLEQEAAHLLVADARDHRALQPQPGGAEGDVGRRAAEVFREAGGVFEPAADLLRVEVDREPAQAGQVPATAGGEVECAHGGQIVTPSSSPISFCISVPPAIMSSTSSLEIAALA